jgi:hypothetical protein
MFPTTADFDARTEKLSEEFGEMKQQMSGDCHVGVAQS